MNNNSIRAFYVNRNVNLKFYHRESVQFKNFNSYPEYYNWLQNNKNEIHLLNTMSL